METSNIKVIIADDSAEFLDGLEMLINAHPHYKVVGKANSGNALLELLTIHIPDIILIDVNMPGLSGFETAHVINFRFRRFKMIAVTMHTERVYLLELLEAGFKGFISKENITNQIFDVIERVYLDQTVFPESLRKKTLNKLLIEGEDACNVLINNQMAPTHLN